MTIVEERTIGASLGAENIENGFAALALGMAMTLTFNSLVSPLRLGSQCGIGDQHGKLIGAYCFTSRCSSLCPELLGWF